MLMSQQPRSQAMNHRAGSWQTVARRYPLGLVAMIPPLNAAVAASKVLTIRDRTRFARASCRTASGASPLRAACPYRVAERDAAIGETGSALSSSVAAVERWQRS